MGVDSSDEGCPARVTLGKGEAIKGWDMALRTMQTGEVARFWIDPEYAYGAKGLGKVPPDTTIVFDLTLVSWTCPDNLFGNWGCVRSVREAKDPSSSTVSCSMTNDDGKPIKTEVELSLRTWADGPDAANGGRTLEEYAPRPYVLQSGTLGPLSGIIDKALENMRRGDRVELRCQRELILEMAESSLHNALEDAAEVYADLCLYEIFEETDVSFDKDRSTIRKRVCEGERSSAVQDAGRVRVLVERAVDGEGNTLPNYSEEEFSLTFFVGEGEVCDAMECAVLDMCKGERAVVTCTVPSMWTAPGCACGAENCAPETLDKHTALFTITVDDFENFGSPWEMKKRDLVEFAQQRKDVGGELFKKGRLRLAQERYNGVCELLSDCHQWRTVTREFRESAAKLRLVCCLNMAQCLLKREDYLGCKSACDKVLIDEPGNIKALYRRASACVSRGEFADAEKDLDKLLQIEPKNVDARSLLARASQHAQKAQQDSKGLFAKMGQGLVAETAPKSTEQSSAVAS